MILQPYSHLGWKHHCLRLGHTKKAILTHLGLSQSISLTKKVARHYSSAASRKNLGKSFSACRPKRQKPQIALLSHLFFTLCAELQSVSDLCRDRTFYTSCQCAWLCSWKSTHMMHFSSRAAHHGLETLSHCAWPAHTGKRSNFSKVEGCPSHHQANTEITSQLSQAPSALHSSYCLPPLSPEETILIDLAGYSITPLIYSHKQVAQVLNYSKEPRSWQADLVSLIQ